MEYTQQISVFLENRPGTLAELTDVLWKNNIDMRAMCVADAMDFGIARIIVDDVYETMTVLKDAGYVCQITKVLTVEMADEPGGLSKILALLGSAGINLEYTYAFLSRKKDTAYLVLKVAEPEKAEAVLRAEHIRLIGQETLQGIFGD
ncbi:MAG: ACT domain-containing protein [Lachnospiraceae bacterium]|nr:ACT domain-containing protein [Lachnospiraceae bacterium]